MYDALRLVGCWSGDLGIERVSGRRRGMFEMDEMRKKRTELEKGGILTVDGSVERNCWGKRED